MDLPVVTPENYYSLEMNMAYMGSTQFKAFEKCEAAALAELRGEYTPPTSQAFLVGGYIDAWFSGELPLYQAQHPEIFKRDGTLKAEYVKAAEIVARLQADELYSMLMSGKKQVIRTGLIAGVPFKVKIDSLLDANTCNMIANRWPHTAAALGFCDGAIVDQKIMRDTAEVWSEEDHCRLPFVEAYGYDLQGAIYQAIEGHFLPFILAVGTKEVAPDLAALYINDDDLAAKLAEVEDRAPRYLHDVFTHNYGQDLQSLIGEAYGDDIRQSEAIRCIREALEINPYIKTVHQIDVTFEGSVLHLSFTAKTIYGEVTLNDGKIAL